MFKCNDHPPSNVNTLGIMIGPGAFGSHVGILFVDSDDKPIFLHLASHKKLKADNVETNPYAGFVWIQSNFHPTLRKVMAGVCQHCRDTNPEISYSLMYTGEYFVDSEGFEIKCDAPGDGLSCATFVLEIFRKRAFEVLKLEEWPLFKDSELLDRLGKYLEEHTTASAEHIQAIKNSVGTFPRLEPQHVAAGATLADNRMPIGYRAAKIFGACIVEQYSN